MEECIFGHASLDPNQVEEGDWTERQYEQLKSQILAYKYLIDNKPVPSDIVNNIRSYSPLDWEKRRIEKIVQIQHLFKEKFENQDFTMKELGLYFKQRNKEEENSLNNIGPQINVKEELEYNVDCQIDYRKNQIECYLYHIEQNPKNEALINQLKNELKILKIYPLQKKLRKEILTPLVSENDRSNTINLMDSLLFKMPLDRKFYKKPVQQFLKKEKFNDKFEQQLRCGYDMRKKAKQKQFINQVLEAQKAFMEMKKEKLNKLKKRVNMCKNSIENLEIKDKKERDRKERERIQYLKQNNMEEYLKMLNDAKDSRLKEFMNQTDQFIDEIKGKINIQKEIIKDTKKTSDDMEIKEKEKEEKDKEEKGNEEKKDKTGANYYQTAHCKQEEIEDQPKMLKYGKLKSYQIKGLQWLVSLYVNNLNGILADEMGLGKTIQTIALLCYIMEKKNNEGPFLIIAPLATISNWVIEFQRWAPDIKIVVYKGAPAERRQMAFQIKQDRHKYNAVLTTYEYIMKDKYALNKVTWQYIIVDEGHRMKNYKSKFTQTLGTQFNSVYRLLLTGTPLQNNLSELWALLNFLLPKIFNSCDDFEKWFNQPFSSRLPGEKNELTEEQELLIIHRLHNILRPFLLRREKKEVEKELPSKTEYVIKLQISDWQKIVYNQIKEQGLLAEDPSTGRLGNKALMNTMMQLRKVCNHPYHFIDLNNEMFEHIDEWIIKSSGKFEFLDRIIPKLLYFKHKILIFSQMTQLLNILERYFIFKGLKFLRLDGGTKSEERARQIELFSKNDEDYMIFILSTRAGGLGLNLQSADTVIIFDSDWNPQMDIQAQDRAHRIGQKHEVKVFRLISKNTIEEGILEKAAFKKDMDDKVIRAGLYNSKYSEMERRNKLMDILKNENKGDEEEDEILNDEQINEDIARNEEEFNKFQEMDQERYKREKRDEKLKEIKEKLNLNDEQIKNVNYRLLQEYEVPDWVKITNEKEKEIDKVDHVEIGGKDMRVRKPVNYREDYDGDFYDASISEDRSLLHKKRKKENSLSGIDSFDQENSRSNKKKKFGSETNSLRQNSQVDLYNLGEGSSKNNNVNINLGNGGNKVQIHINDDDEEDNDNNQAENTIKSEDKIEIDDDEDEK